MRTELNEDAGVICVTYRAPKAGRIRVHIYAVAAGAGDADAEPPSGGGGGNSF